jgi:hypothetical protein
METSMTVVALAGGFYVAVAVVVDVIVDSKVVLLNMMAAVTVAGTVVAAAGIVASAGIEVVAGTVVVVGNVADCNAAAVGNVFDMVVNVVCCCDTGSIGDGIHMGTSDITVTLSLLILSMLIGWMKSATSLSVLFLPLGACHSMAIKIINIHNNRGSYFS